MKVSRRGGGVAAKSPRSERDAGVSFVAICRGGRGFRLAAGGRRGSGTGLVVLRYDYPPKLPAPAGARRSPRTPPAGLRCDDCGPRFPACFGTLPARHIGAVSLVKVKWAGLTVQWFPVEAVRGFFSRASLTGRPGQMSAALPLLLQLLLRLVLRRDKFGVAMSG